MACQVSITNYTAAAWYSMFNGPPWLAGAWKLVRRDVDDYPWRLDYSFTGIRYPHKDLARRYPGFFNPNPARCREAAPLQTRRTV